MQAFRLCAVLAAAAMIAATLPAAPPVASAPVAVGGSATEKMGKVQGRVTLAELPLEKVLARYAKMSGLKIEAEWAALKYAGITKTTPVTLKAYGLKFEKLLDLTLDSIAKRNRPLAWCLNGETVIVTTQMRVLHRGRAFIALPTKRGASRRTKTGGYGAIAFDQTPLHMVMDFLRDLSGLNLHVNWRALEMSGVTRDTPVTLKVRGVSMRRLLDLLMSQLSANQDVYGSVYWIVDEGVVHISTGSALNQTTKTRRYDVTDLLMAIPNFQGPRINLDANSSNANSNSSNNSNTNNNPNDLFAPAGNDRTTSSGQNAPMTRREMEDQLIEVIKNAIGEEMWKPTGRGSVRIFRGQMMITQTPLGFKLLAKSLVK